jgi:hypothetical protein
MTQRVVHNMVIRPLDTTERVSSGQVVGCIAILDTTAKVSIGEVMTS